MAKYGKQEVVKTVDQYCKILTEKSEKSFEEIGKHRFCVDNYMFVIHPEKKFNLVHTVSSIKGKFFGNLKDAKGRLFYQEFIDIASKDVSSFVQHLWTKPNSDELTEKKTYAKKCGKYILASGFHI